MIAEIKVLSRKLYFKIQKGKLIVTFIEEVESIYTVYLLYYGEGIHIFEGYNIFSYQYSKAGLI